MITVKVYSETAGDRTAARTSLFQDIYLYIDTYLRIIYIYIYIFDDCSVSLWTHGSHLYRYICLSQYQCVGLCVYTLGANHWRHSSAMHPSPPLGPSSTSRLRSIMSVPPAQVGTVAGVGMNGELHYESTAGSSPFGYCGGRGHPWQDPLYLLGPVWGRRWYGSLRVFDIGCS